MSSVNYMSLQIFIQNNQNNGGWRFLLLVEIIIKKAIPQYTLQYFLLLQCLSHQGGIPEADKY